MGKIGPRQQRFEVLPAVPWGIDDLLEAWRADAPAESGAHDSLVPADEQRAAGPEHR